MTASLVLAQPADTGGIPFIEQNAWLIYPVLGVAVVALIAWGFLHAWKSHELDAVRKAEVKAEILRLMRRYVGGMTAEQVAPEVKLDTFQAAKLLEEMVEVGQITCYTTSNRITTYKLKGF